MVEQKLWLDSSEPNNEQEKKLLKGVIRKLDA